MMKIKLGRPVKKPDPDYGTFETFTKNVKRYNFMYISEKKEQELFDLAKKFKKMRVKRIQTSKLNIGTEILIYGNKVGMTNVEGKDFAVVIEDKIIAQSFLVLYKFLWNS